MSSTTRRILAPLFTFLLFLVAWQVISWGLKVPVYLLP